MPLLDDNNFQLSPFKFTGLGQIVTMTGATVQSAAVTSTYVVVLSTAVFCSLAIGSAPTATTAGITIPANKWVALKVGIGNKVAGLAASGSLFINELSN
jgi:hypothetical protein